MVETPCPSADAGGYERATIRRSGSDSKALDEWLSAPEAYRRIINQTASLGTRQAIAQRAHAGVLRAKAQVFIRGPQSMPDAEIPREFWWAGGRPALTQNWDTGDFETWIDHRIHMRALGVSFHLGDLKKAFPSVFAPGPAKSMASNHRQEKLGGCLPNGGMICGSKCVVAFMLATSNRKYRRISRGL